MRFEVLENDNATSARTGRIWTRHGVIETPVFMPVGTQATVKAVTPEMLKDVGAQIVLSNTYHLYLRPGAATIEKAGGLHSFMGWDKPILTDSGGFQIFSLSTLRQISEDGVTFRSHLDGSSHVLTPEDAISIQHQLGADIIMPLDQPVPYGCSHQEASEASDRTVRWAQRCLTEHERGQSNAQALFGIIQGGFDIPLRRKNAKEMIELGFPGYSIGGLSLGEPRQVTSCILDEIDGILPKDKPRYLMGAGSADLIFDGVKRGVDMFDCVLPTRLARHGALLTSKGRLLIKNSEFAEDWKPIEKECDCYTCRNFSRGYLRHLFKAKEVLAFTLGSIHNLRFLTRLMDKIRSAIKDGSFEIFEKQMQKGLSGECRSEV